MSLRVLVTGGTGYIGKNLVAALVSKGYQLAMVSRPSAVLGPDVASNPNITVIRADGERELRK